MKIPNKLKVGGKVYTVEQTTKLDLVNTALLHMLHMLRLKEFKCNIETLVNTALLHMLHMLRLLLT